MAEGPVIQALLFLPQFILYFEGMNFHRGHSCSLNSLNRHQAFTNRKLFGILDEDELTKCQE